jgi:hypothetical protein
MIHIRVVDENENEIGQRFLVVHKLQSGKIRGSSFICFVVGYRHIILRNVGNMSEGPASIFVKIEVDISYPALENEIRHKFESPLEGLDDARQQQQLFANPLQSSGKKREKPNGTSNS